MKIVDENGISLEIGCRVGCRRLGEPITRTQRSLTLIGYEPNSECPYITQIGRFSLAIRDHDPDMDEWIKGHVT